MRCTLGRRLFYRLGLGVDGPAAVATILDDLAVHAVLHSVFEAGLSGLALSEARGAGSVGRYVQLDLPTLPLPLPRKASGKTPERQLSWRIGIYRRITTAFWTNGVLGIARNTPDAVAVAFPSMTAMRPRFSHTSARDPIPRPDIR